VGDKTVAVFGATGGLGEKVVEHALERGFGVRAHTRRPDALGSAVGLTVCRGDLADAASIEETVAGSDAVVWCAGHSRGQEPELYGRALGQVMDAMGAHGVRRLVAISGAGLELEGDAGGFGRRVIITLLKLFAGKVLAGKQHEWAAIRDASDGVDWTLVRVARMADREPAGNVAVDLKAVSGSPMVAYADVAAWMLDQLDDDAFVGKAPFVSGA
jgi:putative NADH-flavin reductase